MSSEKHGHVEVAAVRVGGDARAVGNVDLSTVKFHGDSDELELAALGKKQVLRRNFGFWSILGLALSSTITYEGMLCVFVYGLYNGGPTGLVWQFVFSWIGYMAAMASLGELTSMVPTAGGQYHWVYLLAPDSVKNIFSYITGWQTVIAWQAGVASTGYLGGTMIQGLAILNYPEYAEHAQRWHATLLLFGVLFFATFFNTILVKFLPHVERFILIIHMCLFLGILIPLVVLAPHKATAAEVFANFQSNAGWEPAGLTFLIGTVSATFAFIGADGAVHMCEEVANATRVVPWTMVASIAINGTFGFAIVLAVLFCIGDIENALNSKTGYPYMEIFHQAVDSVDSVSGSTAMASFIILIIFFCSISLFAAASRLTWAFARDKGMPGSRWLGHVDPQSKLPLWSCLLTLLISLLLSLINIGSTAAFNAVVSLVVAGFLGSYLLPIGLVIWLRITNPSRLKWGPWCMGPTLGMIVNVVALLWSIVAMLFSFFPTSPIDLSAKTMNWSCLLYGGTNLLALLFYFVYGKYRYDGPIIETTLAEQLS